MKSLVFFLLVSCSFQMTAQNNENLKSIRGVIDQLFDGMRAGDSTAVRSVFHETARLQSAFTNKEGKAVLRTQSIDGFVAAVGKPHDEVWDERIWSFNVNIEGRLATVWTDYTFYAGERLSHCGVNAFHLFHSAAGWKITQITDTRSRDDCQTK